MKPPIAPYRSFWMGGFEGADHINGLGQALDMSLSSGHLDRLDEDYANAARFGLRSVRESVGWRLAEPAPGRYDFARVRNLAAAGRRHGVQIVWTLMHYGTPAYIDFYDDRMIERFAAFAAAAAREIGPLSDDAPIYNPINEINFLAWAVSATEMIHPYPPGGPDGRRAEARGYAVKRRLVQAVLAGVDAVRRVDPRARFLHIEPLLHVCPPAGHPQLQPRADEVRSYQWQAWDLIAGFAEPELGGSLAALDLVGVNYYHSGQWEAVTEKRLDWAGRDPRRIRFSGLLCEAWNRYRRPLVIAETSHVGSGRADWLNEIAAETAEAQRLGAHVDGICLYPLVDRHDWSDPRHWHRSGLWDAGSDADPELPAAPQRLLQLEYAEALRNWQSRPWAAGRRAPAGDPVATLLVFAPQHWTERRRLQQWMLRLGRDHGYAVTIVEEPVQCSGAPYLDRRPVAPGVEVLVPHIPLPAGGFDGQRVEAIAGLLIAHGSGGPQPLVAWVAAPTAWALARRLKPSAMVWDRSGATTQSSLHALPGAEQSDEPDLLLYPPEYRGREATGRKLHTVSSGVDLSAFDPQRMAVGSEEGETTRHLQNHIVAPRLGYFGPVDADFDLPLLTALADRRLDWNFVIVGALHGIEPKALPQRPNLHWIGPQTYHRLGYFAAGWDAVVLPAKVEGAAPWYCPEQLLEALATGKPVISSALPAVVRQYGEYLSIADGLEAWLRACAAATSETPAARHRRADALRPLLEAASWDASAADIAQRLAETLERLKEGGFRPSATARL